MNAGKLSSQAGHAFLNSYINAYDNNPYLAKQYQIGGIGTKVCLKAKTSTQLHKAHEAAIEAGLPCSLITDSGHIMPPHFDGSPIITALGIGPATRDQIHHITKRFSLVK